MMTTEAPIALQTLHPQSNDTRPAQPTELALDDRHNKLNLTAVREITTCSFISDYQSTVLKFYEFKF
jgi:hypothetical protein